MDDFDFEILIKAMKQCRDHAIGKVAKDGMIRGSIKCRPAVERLTIPSRNITAICGVVAKRRIVFRGCSNC